MYTTPDSFKCNDKDECENAFMWKIAEFSILKFSLFYNMFLSKLRAAVSKYQKSLVSRDILDLLIFCLNDPFGELFLKITLESLADF